MTTNVLALPEAFRSTLETARAEGRRIGFVPTMGALHEGHLTLVREARARVGDTGLVAVSIFVNPTQFGPNEDFAKYPRTLEADIAALAPVGTDLVFAPEAGAMYPPGDETRVRVGALAEPLCGRFRPGHFEGVATVVTRLLVLAGPCVAVFGRKDYQQLCVIRRLVRDLFLPVDVVGVRTVREADGLAKSSRNRYLSPEARAKAAAIPKALGEAVRAWEGGVRDVEALRKHAESQLRTVSDRIDYVSIVDPETLQPLPVDALRALMAIALHLGGARLIDNVVLGEEPAPA